MLSVVNTDWSIVARPDKREPFRIMLDAVAYIAIFSNYGRFNLSLKKPFLASRYIQRIFSVVSLKKPEITSHLFFSMQLNEHTSASDCLHA